MCSKVKERRVIYCSKCMTCIHDCKVHEDIKTCVNHVEMISLDEINEMVREQNVNIRRFCKDNDLKYYILMDMLKGKKNFKYKYYYLVIDRLKERSDYLPYIDDGEVD